MRQIKTSWLQIIFVAFALGACTPMPLSDAWLNFGGRVTDQSGHPVEGVRLTILIDGKPLGNEKKATDSQGRYSFFVATCPCHYSFTLNAYAPGFKPYSFSLDSEQAHALTQKDIALEPE